MSSTVPDIQKIGISLSEQDISVDPGSVASLSIKIANHQDISDLLLIEIEGVDEEWYNIPEPSLQVAAGGTAEARIHFKLARSCESRAGSYPFVIRVRAMETGEQGVAQAMLVVKHYDMLQLEMSPRRATSGFFHALNDFEITVSNLGNIERVVELHADDSNDACAYEFDQDRITLKPGQSEAILMAARPKSSSFVGRTETYGFSVTVRSVDDSYVSARVQGLIERHAFISPLLGIFFLLLILIAGGFFLFRPSPPIPTRILAFTALPQSIFSGQPVTLSWNVQGDHPTFTLKQRLGINGIDEFDSPPSPNQLSGNMQLQTGVVTAPASLYVTLQVNGRGGRDDKIVEVKLTPPPAQPHPLIRNFTADTSAIHLGEKVTLSFSIRNAQKVFLDPGNIELQPQAESYIVTPNPPILPADVTYKLRAYGSDPNMPPAVRKLSIHVVSPDTSIASIQVFRYEPKIIYFGDKVTLLWNVMYTPSVSISTLQNGQLQNGLPAHSKLSVIVNQQTTFILTAADNLGKSVTQQITVTPLPKPIPPLSSPAAGSSGNQTGSSPSGAAPPSTPPASGVPPTGH